ncbi:MAG: sigma-54-dependent Fis family transcriptional regulator [Flavobacteriaceae bacterium]|nr:sigma-54-dependent Fis family transcriptional regulator [Flavobacteriaceae bacterium]
MNNILIIEDEAAIRRVLKDVISRGNKNYTIKEAEDGIEGWKYIKKEEFDLILCDIKMPKMDGIELLQKIKENSIDIPVIMISGHGDLDTAVESMKIGAFDYISKPPDLNRLLIAVKNALENKKLTKQTKTLTKENKILKKKISKNYEMIGGSKAISAVKDMIEKVAPTDARVLITGPNGTGKELVAHWVHEKSNRCNNKIIEINCAAIPSELIESELFGHVKGSFTGANKDSAGKFEAANGGTVFLDEIGDMSLSAQAKVLRALQENKISRVGSDKSINIDVRVIAASNKNLRDEIEKGNFREDLYHRLAVIVIEVPALNDRTGDIPELVNYFLEKIATEQGNPTKKITQKAIALLVKYDWTGNIRELRNIIERLIILSGKSITDKDVINFSKK